MASRTIPASLALPLLLAATACGDNASTEDSSETSSADTTMDGMDEISTSADTSDTSSSEDTTTGTTGTTTAECVDQDQDGYGENCEMGPDCDDTDFNNHTQAGCDNCMDADGDGQWVGCDTYDENKPGEDCDDSNYNVFTADGCANCVDEDMDGVWVGCDQYGDMAPGPDCDDDNPDIGLGDQQELCNGLAENCAGEIDNAPADEMCGDKDWPNVAAMNGYCCEPPAPGEDGCCIQNCVDQFFDLDENDSNGCECAGTSRDHSRAFCSDELQGYLGSVAEGDQLDDLLPGTIPELDNGFEGGREDWYSVDFPAEGNPGARPNTGSIQVDFAQNDGGDYRFEVYRTCDGEVFGGPYGNNHNALVKTFGAGAPPTLEWWFYDYHPDIAEWPDPVNPVAWPSKVYIRVFRVQNGNTCNAYRLRIQRIPN